MRKLFFCIFILLVSFIHADDIISEPEKPLLILRPPEHWACSINFKDGSQTMLFTDSGKTYPNDSAVILPIPSPADSVKFTTENISQGYALQSADVNLYSMPVHIFYPFLISLYSTQMCIQKSTSGLFSGIFYDPADARIFSAADFENLKEILPQWNILTEPETVDLLKPYVKQNYSFAVMFKPARTDPKHPSNNNHTNGIKIKFPATTLYYPSILHQNKKINDFYFKVIIQGLYSADSDNIRTYHLYDSQASDARYPYFNEHLFTKILPINYETKTAPFSITPAPLFPDRLIAYSVYLPIQYLLIFIKTLLYSAFIGVIAGFIVLRSQSPSIKKLALAGMCNVLCFPFYSLGALYFNIDNHPEPEEGKKIALTLIIIVGCCTILLLLAPLFPILDDKYFSLHQISFQWKYFFSITMFLFPGPAVLFYLYKKRNRLFSASLLYVFLYFSVIIAAAFAFYYLSSAGACLALLF